MRRVPVPLGLALGLLLVPSLALAAWTATGSGGASSKAFSMPTGTTPAVSVFGRNVSVSWAASTFPNGDPVAGYLVRRYDASSGTPQTVLSDCAGTLAGLSCAEHAVPTGTWRYTVTPVHGPWTGAEGALSASVTVAAPSLSLTPATVTSLPATLSGTIDGFATGESVTFRLDDPNTGTPLTGSISPNRVPADGQASVSVTLPSGTAPGMHTVYAVGSLGTVASASVEIAIDTVAPSIGGAVIQKDEGGTASFVRQGGSYRVYADVTDPAPYASGVATVTADVSALTAGQTAVPLVSGSWVVDGATYTYRSALLTVDNPRPEGAVSFSISATDAAGNAATQGGFTVTVDNTAPSGADVQTANASGGIVGHAETGDTITLTFSEPMEPASILTGWDGTATTVTVRLINTVDNDRIEVWDSANTTQVPLGAVALGGNYVTATRTFTASTMAMSGSTVTVTLGTPSGGVRTVNASSTATWTPSATAYDRAANACLTTAVTESGPADPEF